MRRYTLVNWSTGECVHIDALALEVEHYSWVFYMINEEERIMLCAYSQRYWDIRNIENITTMTEQQLMQKWLAITGRPSLQFARARFEEERDEFNIAYLSWLDTANTDEALYSQAQVEAGDVAFCALQLAELGDDSELAYAFSNLQLVNAGPYFRAVLEANLTKVTPCWQLGREEALAHAKSLECERYPTVEALPGQVLDYGHFWVWRCTSGPHKGKVLKGPHFKPAQV